MMQQLKYEHPCSNEELCQQVCAGLSHALRYFHNTVQLVGGPLIQEFPLWFDDGNGGGTSSLERAHKLREMIASMAEQLKPSPHYAVVRKYIDGRATDMPERSFYRYRSQATKVLAHALLADKWQATGI
jgi:hypothetical protein